MSEQPERRAHSATAKRETQFLSPNDTIVYEAIATRRQTMNVADLVAMTGLDEGTVRASLAHLLDQEMIREADGGVILGPNDWDIRGY